MAFYSVRPRVRNAIRRPQPAYPMDPYHSNPDYAERHQESVSEGPHGTIRVDLGEPINGTIVKRPKASEPEPAREPEATVAAPPPVPTVTPKRPRKERHFGLNKDA